MIIRYDQVGQRLRAARRAMGLTQQQLAFEAKLSPAFMGHIERGTRIPSLETVVKLSQTLGVSVDSLLVGAVAESDARAEKTSHTPAEVKERVRALLAMASWELEQMS